MSGEASQAGARTGRPQINSSPCQECLALDTTETVSFHCEVRFQSLFAQVLIQLSSVEERQATLYSANQK